MSWMDAPVTLFRAMKVQGKVLCVDARVIGETTKIVRNSDEYHKAIGQGWCDDPEQAIARFDADEEAVSRAAAELAYQHLRMSAAAQREAEAYEATVPLVHVPVIPEASK